MKPKVVILSAFLSPFRSGAEACVEEVAARLAGRFDITIVTAKLQKLPGVSWQLLGGRGVRVIRVGIGCSFDKWLFPFLAPFVVRRCRPDIVHAVLETFAGAALFFCRWMHPQARRVLTLQTTNRSFLKCPIVRSAHRVTAISSVLVEAAHRCGREAALIPNGVDFAAIRAACARHPKVSGRILFVGRLEKMKGVDTLLSAFREVVEKFPQAHLRIVGDGSQKSLLVARCSLLVQQGKIVFAGHISQPDLYSEFVEAEIFCALPRSEAMGNVFLEAQ
ncbi:glycosyltransferase family 4 protein, partial [Candidatus Peregrinibacteria bacterium]|nr:glycosyltransferase family 4 protein [Candidatus Peregrinibacteria bacterium]